MLYLKSPYIVLNVWMAVKNSEPFVLKTICFSYFNVEYAPVKLYSYAWGSTDVHLLMQTLLKLFVQRFDCLNLQTIHSFYFNYLLYIYGQSFNIFFLIILRIDLMRAQLLITTILSRWGYPLQDTVTLFSSFSNVALLIRLEYLKWN